MLTSRPGTFTRHITMSSQFMSCVRRLVARVSGIYSTAARMVMQSCRLSAPIPFSTHEYRILVRMTSIYSPTMAVIVNGTSTSVPIHKANAGFDNA